VEVKRSEKIDALLDRCRNLLSTIQAKATSSDPKQKDTNQEQLTSEPKSNPEEEEAVDLPLISPKSLVKAIQQCNEKRECTIVFFQAYCRSFLARIRLREARGRMQKLEEERKMVLQTRLREVAKKCRQEQKEKLSDHKLKLLQREVLPYKYDCLDELVVRVEELGKVRTNKRGCFEEIIFAAYAMKKARALKKLRVDAKLSKMRKECMKSLVEEVRLRRVQKKAALRKQLCLEELLSWIGGSAELWIVEATPQNDEPPQIEENEEEAATDYSPSEEPEPEGATEKDEETNEKVEDSVMNGVFDHMFAPSDILKGFL